MPVLLLISATALPHRHEQGYGDKSPACVTHEVLRQDSKIQISALLMCSPNVTFTRYCNSPGSAAVTKPGLGWVEKGSSGFYTLLFLFFSRYTHEGVLSRQDLRVDKEHFIIQDQ